MLICNNINDPGYRIHRYYGGTQATNVTTVQNADSSPLYFTQPIGINIAPTANIDLAVNGNISSTTVFSTNISSVNASFDTVWCRNIIADPSTLREVSISDTGIVQENVCYSTIFNPSCITMNISNISCTNSYITLIHQL